MTRLRSALTAALLLAAAPTGAAEAGSLYGGPAPRPGPDLLYADPPRAPQLENTGVWKAAPILVSGAQAYRDGEFVYQDFLFDDHGARVRTDPNDERTGEQTFSAVNGTYTYPSDKAKYANNVADLVEVRLRPLAGATAFRLTFQTMLDPGLVGTTIALGSSPASLPVPGAPSARMPAEVFVTVHGATARAQAAGTGADLGPAPSVSIDRERRQVEVRVPHAVWDPGTAVQRVAVATGLWDPAAGRYLVPGTARSATQPGGGSGAGAPFFNVAFRTREPAPQVSDGTQPFRDPRWWRDKAQADALADGDLAELFAEVDFAKLAAGATDDSAVPSTGALNRIMASRFEPHQGVDFAKACGSRDRCDGPFGGQLQPYAIYVPAKPAPASGYGLTLLLHSLAGTYNQYLSSRNQSQLGDRGSGHIVITPLGRGPDGWYYDLAGADVFEVWNDVARRYPLDPDRAVATGYSMGGFGTYKLVTQWPDLFAAANTVVGPPTLGISTTGRDSTGGEPTSTLPQLSGFRHVPVIVWAGTTDQLVPFSGVVAQVSELDRLGFRYVFDAFAPADHFALAVHDQYQPVADFLGERRVVRDPARITFTVNPTMDFPRVHTVADHAYWVSGVRTRAQDARGSVDVRSEGFGEADPPAGPQERGGGALTGGTFGALAFAEQRRSWGAPASAPVRNRLTIRTTNVAALTIHPGRARVGCDAELDVRTDAPLSVTLAGCGRSAAFGPTTACPARSDFARASVVPAGRALRIDARRRGGGAYTVDVLRQASTRRLVGTTRAARARGRRAITLRRVRGGDGTFLVRLRAGADVRRFVVERRGGRFRRVPTSERRSSCGLLSRVKLDLAAFGGPRRRALGLAIRVREPATVSVVVTRGSRVVRRFAATRRAAGRTHRLRLGARGLRRGLHRVRVVARGRDGRRATVTVAARRV